LVVQQREVLLLKTGDSVSGLIGYDNIERDLAIRCRGWNGRAGGRLVRMTILLRSRGEMAKAE
jgi:hypothetical protein